MNDSWSKQLGHSDTSGFEFSKELLHGDKTAAINFDRLQKHPTLGYIMIEYLLCEESQRVTPYTSHPNRYWHKNASKFLSLWRAACDLPATLYLVNYAKKGTRAEDEVLLIEVLDLDETGITREQQQKFTRESFSRWFRNLNAQCLTSPDSLIEEIYRQKGPEKVGHFILIDGAYKGKTIEYVFHHDPAYLAYMRAHKFAYSAAIAYYLREMAADLPPF